MMPGQEPYTKQELETLSRLIGVCCQLQNEYSEDELKKASQEDQK